MADAVSRAPDTTSMRWISAPSAWAAQTATGRARSANGEPSTGTTTRPMSTGSTGPRSVRSAGTTCSLVLGLKGRPRRRTLGTRPPARPAPSPRLQVVHRRRPFRPAWRWSGAGLAAMAIGQARLRRPPGPCRRHRTTGTGAAYPINPSRRPSSDRSRHASATDRRFGTHRRPARTGGSVRPEPAFSDGQRVHLSRGGTTSLAGLVDGRRLKAPRHDPAHIVAKRTSTRTWQAGQWTGCPRAGTEDRQWPQTRRPRRALGAIGQLALGAVLLTAGIGHLTTQRQEFQAQVPSWSRPIPTPSLWSRRCRARPRRCSARDVEAACPRVVGGTAAAFFVAVFPGNIAAIHGSRGCLRPGHGRHAPSGWCSNLSSWLGPWYRPTPCESSARSEHRSADPASASERARSVGTAFMDTRVRRRRSRQSGAGRRAWWRQAGVPRAPCSALVRPAAAYVLTGEHAACDLSYQDIPVVVGGLLDDLSGPRVTVGEAKQHRNGLVAQLRAGVHEQDLDQVRHHVRHAQLLGPAGLAREGVHARRGGQLDGIAQSQGETDGDASLA